MKEESLVQFQKPKNKIWVKLAIILAMLAVIFGSLYFFWYQPRVKVQGLAMCLSAAAKKFQYNWNKYCISDKRPIDKKGMCTLAKSRADFLNSNFDKEKNSCNNNFK